MRFIIKDDLRHLIAIPFGPFKHLLFGSSYHHIGTPPASLAP